MALAAESGVRILPILANNWPDFGGAPAVLRMVAPDEKLPKDAFWRDERAQRAQLDYQVALASRINSLNGRRYADDPTLFAWELVNEARIERRFGRYRGNARTLAHWDKRMATGLRDAGVQQPIAWGGAGYLGEHGEDLRIIAAEGGVDILTSHLYGTRVRATRGRSRAAVAIAWGEAHLRAQYEVARAAGLPLLLEEVNWKPEAHNDAAERAHVLRAWLEMAHGLGVGTLPWMIGERGREDYDGYLIRPEDNASCEVLQRA
jgi:mannan endo-1,4-beta-mannosidase